MFKRRSNTELIVINIGSLWYETSKGTIHSVYESQCIQGKVNKDGGIDILLWSKKKTNKNAKERKEGEKGEEGVSVVVLKTSNKKVKVIA